MIRLSDCREMMSVWCLFSAVSGIWLVTPDLICLLIGRYEYLASCKSVWLSNRSKKLIVRIREIGEMRVGWGLPYPYINIISCGGGGLSHQSSVYISSHVSTGELDTGLWLVTEPQYWLLIGWGLRIKFKIGDSWFMANVKNYPKYPYNLSYISGCFSSSVAG